MGREPRGATQSRVVALDGLRGLAVAAVLLYHSQFSWARGGFLGVSAFFTLSGFLITSLLLGSPGHAGTRLRDFWARRARRLLPASMLTLVGVLIYGATVASADQLRMLRGDVLATLGYVANWRFYVSGQSYAQLFSAPSPVLHFWSLAIEEQFYLVFPLVVALVVRVGRRGADGVVRRRALGALLGAGIIASVIAGRVLYPTHGSARVYYGTDTRAAELLIGALLAVILSGRVKSDRPTGARTRALTTGAGVGALALMAWWWSTVDQRASWLYHGGFALHALCAAIVIVAARVDGPLARALAWRPLAGLGLISYGVYLFHWPIFLWLSPDRTGLPAVPLLALRLALTLTLAVASYRFVEQPILRGARLPRPQIGIVIPATAFALIAALFLITASLPAPNIVFAPLSARPSTLEPARAQAVRSTVPAPPPTPAPVPLFRAFTAARPLRVLVEGDSVGQTLGRGLELWGYTTGRAQVENDATPLCSLGRALPRKLPLGQVETPSEACAGWAQTWPTTISTFDPDVVVVLYSVWEAEARKLPDGRFAQPGDPALDRWQLGEYRAAADVLSARGAPVLWLDVACEGDPIKPKEPFWVIDYQTIPALVASRPAVHEIDMNHLICPKGAPNPDFDGVTNIRPDSAHFTDAGALAVSKYLMPIILGEQPAPKRIFP